MTNRVPQFPGKPPVVGAQQDPVGGVPPWAAVMCPDLTAGSIARTPLKEKSKLETLDGKPAQEEEEGKAIPCQGPRCAIFVQATMNGQPFAGCAKVLAVLEANKTAVFAAKQLDATNELLGVMKNFLKAIGEAQSEPAGVAVAPPPAPVVPPDEPTTANPVVTDP